MLRALYVGRFQPPHSGHLKAIEYIINEVDELAIIIGSAQESHSLCNPFTAGERITMMRAALNELKIDSSKYYLIPVPDAPMHSLWVSEIISYSPPFNIVYSNEPLTLRLFKESKVKVKKIPLFDRKLYSSTEVRRRMLSGEDWQELLPSSVVKTIEAINGIERLKELTNVDTFKQS